MSEQHDVAVELESLAGRTIDAADIVAESEFGDVLRLVLDDGRSVDIGGYTGTFDEYGYVTVRPSEAT